MREKIPVSLVTAIFPGKIRDEKSQSLVRLGFFLWLFLFFFPVSAQAQRVVAVGDVHGDFDAFVGILQRARLIDANRKWTGRNTTLVQTGDILDRGPKVRQVMDLLMDLQKDAPRQGGRVVVLMGNHEAMNIYGDLRYVSDADNASFEGAQTRCDAFQAEGKYGKWLRTLPAVARIDDTIFLHGGISPELASWTVQKINDGIAAEIRAFDAYRKYLLDRKLAGRCATLEGLTSAARKALETAKDEDAKVLKSFLQYAGWLSFHPDGPLWFRGYAEWPEPEGAAHMRKLTESFNVKRFVVGHTTQPGQITSRFDGKVYLIDTGMLAGYVNGGRASAWSVQAGKVETIY